MAGAVWPSVEANALGVNGFKGTRNLHSVALSPGFKTTSRICSSSTSTSPSNMAGSSFRQELRKTTGHGLLLTVVKRRRDGSPTNSLDIGSIFKEIGLIEASSARTARVLTGDEVTQVQRAFDVLPDVSTRVHVTSYEAWKKIEFNTIWMNFLVFKTGKWSQIFSFGNLK